MRWLKSYQDVLLIVLIGFVLRATVVGYLHQQGYTGDEREYISLASKLAQGEPFVDSNGEWSTKAPLWPFLVSLVFRVFGDGLLIPHLFGCMLGAAAIYLGFVLGMEVTGKRYVSLVTAACIALYPGLVIYSAMLQTESLYVVFMLAVFILLERQRREPTVGKGALIGVCAAFTALTRAVFFGFFILVILYFIVLYRKELGAYGRSLAVMTATWIIVLTPWTIRNYSIHGEFVPISSWGGISMLLGNNPYSTGTWSSKPGFEAWFESKARENNLELARSTEIQRSKLGRKVAIEFVLSEPGEAAKLALKKFYMHWVYPISNTDSDTRLQAVCIVADIVMYLFAGIGCVTVGRTREGMFPAVLALAFFTLLQVLLHCEARYRLPLMPIVAMYAASGVAMLVDLRERNDFAAVPRNRILAGSWVVFVGGVYAFTAWQFLAGNI